MRQSLNRRKPTSGAEKQKKKNKLKNKTKRCRSVKLCTAFSISLYKVKAAKSDSDFAVN
ncbi:hypothetical protein [Ruminococcus sp.]